MTPRKTGWLVFTAAIGMMCGLMSSEIAELMTWGDMVTPAFIGKLLAHFGTVIGAFMAGKLIPTD